MASPVYFIYAERTDIYEDQMNVCNFNQATEDAQKPTKTHLLQKKKFKTEETKWSYEKVYEK